MVEIKKIKITKKAYTFDIRKRYYSIKRYKLRKKTLPEQLFGAFSKKAEPVLVKKKVYYESKPPKSGGINPMIMGVALVLALVALGGVWMYLTLLAAQAEIVLPGEQVKPFFDLALSGTGISTAGERNADEYIGYITSTIQQSGIIAGNATIFLYGERPQSEVFILESEREAAETKTYPQFVQSLRKKLAEKRILLNELDFEQLESIPKGAIVIIPTGSIHEKLLGINSNIKIKTLLERGVVIIYIGKAFTKGMVTSAGPIAPTPKAALDGSGFIFNDNVPLSVDGGFHVYQPLYRATGGTGWGGSTAFTTENLEPIYGFISVVKRGDGAFVFIPQTLDGAWENNADLAADDIMRLVVETPWLTPINEPAIYYFGEDTNHSGKLDFFSNTFTASMPQSAKLHVIALTPDNNQYELVKMLGINKNVPGELYIDGGYVVAPYDITGKKVRLNAQPNGASSEDRFLFLSFTKGGEEVGERIQIEGSRNIQTESTFDVEIHVDGGEYVVHLIDDSNTEYAQTYMYVVSVDIVETDSIGKGIYNFNIEKEGAPVKIAKIDFSIDGIPESAESFTDISKVTIDTNKFTIGQGLQPREKPYVFTFKIGKLVKKLEISVSKTTTILDEPMFQVTIAVVVLILGVGFYFARKEEVAYLIDIPDFPPIERTKITITPEAFAAVFEKVNEDYRWKFTPLTVVEIKNGFKKIFREGKPIHVSDYNLEFVLHDLERTGEVKECLNYFGPTEWEKASGYDLKYLSMMRKIRDICVNNAVPFTQLNESKDCDCEITCMGQQMYVHIYNGNDLERLKNIVKQALKTIKMGITPILFTGASDKKEFEMLLSSPSSAFLTLKLEYDSSSLLLLTTDEFEKMIKELKEI